MERGLEYKKCKCGKDFIANTELYKKGYNNKCPKCSWESVMKSGISFKNLVESTINEVKIPNDK